MAFTKRELSPRPEPKRAELDVSGPDSLRTTSNQLRVMLNPAGCDLVKEKDIVVDRKMASPFHSVSVNLKAMLNLLMVFNEEAFAYCWSVARANTGITRWKYCFG
ncbi:hypothetical protein NC652_010396 [Populus alba x Populus x berolinensis]|nr:hypothetical protein NC652_010396 [Populus alba x Populus x berolinensis]